MSTITVFQRLGAATVTDLYRKVVGDLIVMQTRYIGFCELHLPQRPAPPTTCLELKKSVLVLVLQMLMLCCEIRSCYGRRHNAGHSSFQVRYYLYFLYSVLGTTLLWRSTVAFTNLKVKSTKCLCLLPTVLVLVLVLLFWSWSCKQRSWS